MNLTIIIFRSKTTEKRSFLYFLKSQEYEILSKLLIEGILDRSSYSEGNESNLANYGPPF